MLLQTKGKTAVKHSSSEKQKLLHWILIKQHTQ